MRFNKVEICGINTCNLKVLSEEEKLKLFKIMKSGSQSEKIKAREKMIKGNLKLVLSIIQRFASRGESADDLFQVGCIGLIKAIDNFNVDLNVKFSTYGVPMIIGEIRRFLRDNNSVRVSRSLRDIAYKSIQVKETIMEKYNREPTVEEIAKELDVEKEEVVLALEAVVEPISLYEPVFSDNNDTIFIMDQIGNKDDDLNWISELSIKEELKKLPIREKKILSLRFMKGMTQIEVAKSIGISQAQVSRLEKNSIRRIKNA